MLYLVQVFGYDGTAIVATREHAEDAIKAALAIVSTLADDDATCIQVVQLLSNADYNVRERYMKSRAPAVLAQWSHSNEWKRDC